MKWKPDWITIAIWLVIVCGTISIWIMIWRVWE